MSDSDELFDKADALLGRYRGEQRDPGGEPDYPVLTEIVDPAPGERPAQPPDSRLNEEPSASAGLTDEQLRDLELRILEQLEMALQPLVEATFAQAFSEQFEQQLRWMLHQLTEQAKADVEGQLRERLSEAVRLSFESLNARGEPD
jgi:hypothetical protein